MEAIWLGPLGRLVKMDVPSGGFQASIVEYGAEHVPLSGRRTKDIFSRRREYQIKTDGLAPRALSWLEMIYTGAIAGPHYLLESTRKNRLRTRISTTASVPLALNAVGGLDWIGPGTVAITPATALMLPNAGVSTPAPSKALAWTSTGASQTLADSALTPVLPGETVCFSAYVQAGSPGLEIVPYNAALAAQAPVTGTVIVAGSPPRRYVTYTAPSDGSIVAVAPQLRAPAIGTFTTLAWQLEPASEPTDWELGAGSPQVMLSSATGQRHAVGPYTDVTYDLKEV